MVGSYGTAPVSPVHDRCATVARRGSHPGDSSDHPVCAPGPNNYGAADPIQIGGYARHGAACLAAALRSSVGGFWSRESGSRVNYGARVLAGCCPLHPARSGEDRGWGSTARRRPVQHSQLTTYKILDQLTGRGINWLTLRQRGKGELARLAALPASA